jgi:hypothetical protein
VFSFHRTSSSWSSHHFAVPCPSSKESTKIPSCRARMTVRYIDTCTVGQLKPTAATVCGNLSHAAQQQNGYAYKDLQAFVKASSRKPTSPFTADSNAQPSITRQLYSINMIFTPCSVGHIHSPVPLQLKACIVARQGAFRCALLESVVIS